ncbi:MAG: hypothetical protein JWL63_1315 [Rhodocyclales bacterium]|nr:hypothetical protein [Rhodocyclales bacterium]
MDSAQNPYQAPKSEVSDISHQEGEKLSLKQIWFSFEGRVPRKVFWLYGFLLMLPLYAVVGIAFAISPKLGLVVAVPLYIVMVWAGFAMQVKRWHDRDKSGWWLLLSFIPFANIWAFIETGFLRGSEGGNRFGGDGTGLY